jgi:hypothetical protein
VHQRRTASVDFNFPESVLTAGTVAILFLFGGRELLRLLGITIAEFMVAAGLLILVITLSDVITPGKSENEADRRNLGAVRPGVPLIAGPAGLTTSILLLDAYRSMRARFLCVLESPVSLEQAAELQDHGGQRGYGGRKVAVCRKEMHPLVVPLVCIDGADDGLGIFVKGPVRLAVVSMVFDGVQTELKGLDTGSLRGKDMEDPDGELHEENRDPYHQAHPLV